MRPALASPRERPRHRRARRRISILRIVLGTSSSVRGGLQLTTAAASTAQLLCLGEYLGDHQPSQVWGALSRAAHFDPYELPPTREELNRLCDTVGEVLDKTERAWLRT